MRAVGWVRVRLAGAVGGRRLTELAGAMPLRRVEAVRGGLEMDVRAGDLNAMRHVLRGAGVRMRIVRRYGVVRIRRAARRRGVLLLCAVAAVLVLGGLSQTVLRVDVVGARDAAQEARLMEVLAGCGVRPGVWAASVDRAGAASEVLRSCGGLTYAAVRRRGLGMELYVVQAAAAPEVFDPGAPVDVVAVTGGLVTRVVVLSGEALVRPGDTVVPGQVLIRGTERMPHARGAVTARTWAVGRGEAALREETLVRTGERTVETQLAAWDWRFPADVGRVYPCEEAEEESVLLLDGLFCPVRVVRRVHYEAVRETRARPVAAAKDESGARAMTNALLALKNGACVVDKRVEYCMIEDGKLCAVVTLEGVMQIGAEAEGSAQRSDVE
ncbi:MAG: sporulation protein YqfD [Candidatus Spyradocola sp.]